MRIPSGKLDQTIAFVAVDSVDLKTRKTGLTVFTVYRSRNGGTATLYTTPTITELDTTNMPGVYTLLIDEDTTIAATSDSEEMVLHITEASMAPVTRAIELYRREVTTGVTLDVNATGGASIDWAAVDNPTTTLALTGTTIASTQKVDIETIKTNPVVNGGTVTFTTNSTVASTTNITGGTITTTTNLTNLPTIPANWLTAAGTATDFGTEIATAIWTDTVAGDFTVAASIGKSIMNGVALGTGLTIGNVTGVPKVDVDTIKTNPVVNGGTVTFTTNSTVASTTNITAGTITTATNVTTVNGLAANVITAAATATDFGTEIATAIWTDTTAGDFTVAASIGKSVMNGIALGTGLTVNAVTTVNGLAANVITAAATAADFGTEVAAAVWDLDATAHQTQGTFGQAIGDPVADTNTIFKAVVTDATGATVGADTTSILDDTGTSGVVVASIANNAITSSAIATDAIGADEFAQGAADKVWGTAARILTAGTNIVLAKGVGVTGFNDITAASVWTVAVDGATTAAESMRLHNSALGAKLSGGGTGTEVFRDIADTKDRITATVDSGGNRTAITRDLT